MTRKTTMKTPIDTRPDARLSVSLSPELNDRLEEIMREQRCTKQEVFRRAFVLYSVVAEAKQNKQRFGILDKDKNLLTEIVGI